MFSSPINNVIVQVDQKWVGHFTDILRASQINPANQLNPADLVNIVGTVVTVPQSISKRADYKGFTMEDIRVGDTAIFRYDVIYSFLKMPEGCDPVYKNQIFYRGQSYWAVDIHKLFAVIRNGRIIMVNGYCMIEDMSVPSALILPQHMKRLMQAGQAVLTQIGKNLSHLSTLPIEPGDMVFYDPRVVQNYEIKGKKFGIISQRHIFGKKVASYGDFQTLQCR